MSSSGSAGNGNAQIRAIDKEDVHRLTSAQVVLDLHSAVKELVENALDAGATNIEVRFREYGFESIEVIDNGHGIEPADYRAIALKHYTSKLSKFSDLQAVETFGFRGEALSSLCALASVSMHTATEAEAPAGTMLVFDHSGAVTPGARKQPRQRGTTVIVKGLFEGYPVRRREFERNLKREYAKTQNVLQAYALISKGVRWIVSNTPKESNRKIQQLSVNPSTAADYILHNVTGVYGAKLTSTLELFTLDLASDELKPVSTSLARNDPSDPSLVDPVESQVDVEVESALAQDHQNKHSGTIKVVGAISKPSPAHGRASPDRQFFYINGRPWEVPQVARIFNEVYRSTSLDRYPTVIADFRLPRSTYDVNVTPDKRTIFLHFQSAIQQSLRDALEQWMARSQGTFMLNTGATNPRTQQSQIPTSWSLSQHAAQVSEAANVPEEVNDIEASIQRPASPTSPAPNRSARTQVETSPAAASESASDAEQTESEEATPPAEAGPRPKLSYLPGPDLSARPTKRPRITSEDLDDGDEDSHLPSHANGSTVREVQTAVVPVVPTHNVRLVSRLHTVQAHPSTASTSGPDLPTQSRPFHLQRFQSRLANARTSRAGCAEVDSNNRTSFLHAGVSEESAAVAETELQRRISKSDFVLMDVIGQFNLGFIIARRRVRSSRTRASHADEADEPGSEQDVQTWTDDLFIVDQHASDEKYNFERLQSETIIRSQRLLQPRTLEMTVSDELIAAEHIDTLMRNGFEIAIDEDARPGSKLKLIAQPMSKNTTLGPKGARNVIL
ncbi:ATP-binding mismatch repair protein [Tilletia horrida]|uniref:ATP-binding mismatch repair protein n=1 Tax=Tilletia horrida TaxID=155126 RepID=A0AAN6GTQ8_9BASI|nr:ATP-binding mismatch repair protein [Tilletia horrida]